MMLHTPFPTWTGSLRRHLGFTLLEECNTLHYCPVLTIPYICMFCLLSTTRHCSKTCTVGKLSIPEGAMVCIPLCVLGQLPELWEEAKEFIPERCSV